MKKFAITLFLLICIIPATGYSQTKIGDVTFPNTYMAGKTNLVLNGAGLREKFFLDLYVCALYVKQKCKNDEQVLNADEPMAFRITIVSGLITSDKMKEAVLDGFKKSTGGNMKPIQKEIDAFMSAFLEPLKVGDSFDMVYYDGSMRISKNGKHKVTIPGLTFKKAAVGIWISKDPVSEDLKEDLLGL